MKVCSRCKEAKPLDCFYASKTGSYGRHCYCKPCSTAVSREWNKKHPERTARINRKSKLKTTYGISVVDYDKMLKEQQGVCAICGETEKSKHGKLHVDHDHETGKVRGLLCSTCNTSLGGMKDSPSLLRKAADYLEEHSK